MANQNDLSEYSDSINTLRNQCLDAGMSEDEFRKLYFESLTSLDNHQVGTRPESIRTKYKVIFILVLILGCCIYNYKTIYSCVICHMQEYIYPGLRLLRKITIPFLSLFPSLTDLYHETCLIQNPFFMVTDMDCWPCSAVNNVREIHNPNPSNTQQTAPFIYETEQKVIDLDLLREIYHKNKSIFDKESFKILINNKYHIPLNEMFAQSATEGNNLYVWKFNNVHVAKFLRQYISRPTVVPKFGQSTERFIIADSSQKPFKIPDTECNYSFLLSLSGSRTVNLVPAEECKHQCRSLQVDLKETYLLWYNWWYWRPIIKPTNNVTFVAYVGSYC